MALFGVDVSDWQEAVDWSAVRRTGARFGITKITEGTSHRQFWAETNRVGMAAAGMEAIGLYHFALPGRSPSTQAEHFAGEVAELRRNEFAVLDIEHPSGGSWPTAEWSAFIVAFCSRVDELLGAGRTVIYMSESPAASMTYEAAQWPLWVAGYVSDPPSSWDDHRITDVGPWRREEIVAWQYSSTGRVTGVAGNCDLNIAPDNLRAMVGLIDGPPPPPQPLRPKGPFMFTYSISTAPSPVGLVFLLRGDEPPVLVGEKADFDALGRAVPFIGEISHDLHVALGGTRP